MSKTHVTIHTLIPRYEIEEAKSEAAMRAYIHGKAVEFEERLLEAVGLGQTDAEIANAVKRSVA